MKPILHSIGWLIIAAISVALCACMVSPVLLLFKAIWEWLT